MIKANELRIGNYVIAKGRKKEVLSVDDRGINADVSYGEYGCTDYDGEFDNIFHGNEILPIPLSPEILTKCGFSIVQGSYIIRINTIDKHLELNFIRGEIYPSLHVAPETASSSGGYFPLNKIKSLHQLQNLYFALCGEELKIDL